MAPEGTLDDPPEAAAVQERGPVIPAPLAQDLEDVSWALSTAEASFQRGDPVEALKWLRRAAEAATESSANERAVVIAKAAADLASELGGRGASPPPSSNPSSVTPQTQVPVPPPTAPSVLAATARSGAPPASARSAPPPPPPSAPARAPTGGPPAGSVRPLPPSPPRTATLASSGVRASAPPSAPRGSAIPPSKPFVPKTTPAPFAAAMHPSKLPLSAPLPHASRGSEPRKSRKSSHNLEPGKSRPAPAESRRRRTSRPPPSELPPPVPDARPPTNSDIIDGWPTQAMDSAELSTLAEGMTKDTAELPAAPMVSPQGRAGDAPSPRLGAVKVLVFRTAEGIRVVPVGTRVLAPAVEAVLVALDPDTDLAAWLAGR